MRSNTSAILSVQDLSMVFGGLRAIDRISLEIREAEITALIGPNGAGKTTLFNCVTGVYRPTEGKIQISPRATKEPLFIQGKNPHEINRLGLARTFQNIRLFSKMTVLENVMLGRNNSLKAGIFGALFKTRATRQEEERVVLESRDILKQLGLLPLANEMAANLSYGAQRRLEIARALATDPFLLLLDEPAAGMNPQETKELVETIELIRNENKVSILLIEHDMSLVMNVSNWIYVMDYGRLIAEGNPIDIRANAEVIKAYLGE